MKTVNIQQLKFNAEELISNAINNDEFFEVETKDGTAVVTLSSDVSDSVLKKAVEDKDYTVEKID